MGQKVEEKIKPRQVAVAIPYYRSTEGQKEIEICLVTSRKHEDRYVLPKGGVEKGEEAFQSAVREMWEEAGLLPTNEWSTEQDHKAIGPIDDHKPHKHSNDDNFIPRAVYTAFLIPIKKGKEDCEKNEWPEKDERKRVWMKFDQACDAIEWRKDIFTLLKQSQSHLF